MMVLLKSRLLYLFPEVGIIPLVDNGNARPFRHFAEFIRRQHFQALIDRCHAETAVIAYPRFTLHSFLGRNLDDAGCTPRTVLRRFGSILQDSEALYVRRINGCKHRNIAEYAVDDNQRVVAAGQRGSAAQAYGIQSGRTVGSALYGKAGHFAVDGFQRIGYLVCFQLFAGETLHKGRYITGMPHGISYGEQ